MDILIHPQKLNGLIEAIPSKSQAHRLLICAAFADKPTVLKCSETNRDIEATVDCLNALGSEILRTSYGYSIEPIHTVPNSAHLNCCESGSTLRFLLPIVGALGVDATFHMEGRLPQRPLSPLWEEMERMGCSLSRSTATTIRCQGRLTPGEYVIPGNISSQYITGLLLALPHLNDSSQIKIVGTLESKPYVDLTQQVIRKFRVYSVPENIPGQQKFRSPEMVIVEGDWSNAAFFLAAKELGNQVHTTGLFYDSAQGDRVVNSLLPQLKESITISAADIPDLVPILSIVAACRKGAVFTDIQRLRLKESDRVASVIAMLEALGGKAKADENTLTVYGTGLTGGTVDSANDHRIAMSAAIAATVCSEPVVILGAECVKKSYPHFFEEYRRLGGTYEQYLR
ncbi:MAG: 3-phosphoshikimate 1-carboxyvinyltransferase [Oscillospiraceae bacterium]|nr:3-phosphoshikimate 1-carboxyvinyltransferase [Oscillospiraceae bacterium]